MKSARTATASITAHVYNNELHCSKPTRWPLDLFLMLYSKVKLVACNNQCFLTYLPTATLAAVFLPIFDTS